MTTMNTAILALAFERWLAASAPAGRGADRSEDPEGGRRWRPLATLRHRWQANAPPVARLSNHIRRDIGLPPLPERRGWQWPR